MPFVDKKLVSAALLVPFMVLIVAPLTFCFGNISEISFNFAVIVIPVLTTVSLSSAFVYGLLLLIHRNKKYSSLALAVPVGIAMCVWIQSQVFVWNIGLLNGQNIGWNHWKTYKFIELAGWTLVLAAAIVTIVRNDRLATPFMKYGYILGMLSIAFSAFQAFANHGPDTGKISRENIYEFHPSNNVIVIILDGFQSDYFEHILKCYPDEAGILNGFTFYRNTISRYPSTKGSLPSIVTGSVYKNGRPFNQYLKEAGEKFNLLQAFENKGYRSVLIGVKGTFPGVVPMQDVVTRFCTNRTPPVLDYMNYAVFRSVPLIIKAKIYDKGHWLFTLLMRREYPPDAHGEDIRFLESIEGNAAIKDSMAGTFKMFHFCLPHMPLNVNDKMEFDDGLSNEAGYIKQTRGALRLAGRLIGVLKRMKVYDSSEIVIMSDHGTWEYWPSYSKPGILTGTDSLAMRVQSTSHALLMYKPARASGAVSIDDSPMETTDIACLLKLSGPDNACSGITIAQMDSNRPRTFYFYQWTNGDWKNDCLPVTTEYRITGNVHDYQSYALASSLN